MLQTYTGPFPVMAVIEFQVWEELAEIPDAKRRFNAAEHLVHTTKKNHACFDFDIRFPKMPSYLRRSVIRHALGTVFSYRTRLDLWEKTDGKSGKPRLVYENHAMPDGRSAQIRRHLWKPNIKIKTGMVFLRGMYQMFCSIKTSLCIRDFC